MEPTNFYLPVPAHHSHVQADRVVQISILQDPDDYTLLRIVAERLRRKPHVSKRKNPIAATTIIVILSYT